MTKGGKSRKDGFVLVVALLIVGIVAVMVAGSLVLSITNQRINRNDALTSQVLNVAQGGNAYWKAELVSLYQFMANNFDLYADELNKYEESGGVISCGNYFAIGLDLDRNGTIDIANDPDNPNALPTVSIPIGSSKGDATVKFSVVGSAIRLEGVGELADAKSTVIEEFNISNVDVWNNAVFAESSAAQATIKGRAEIRGAVHLLGTGAAPGDVVLDLTGSFGMGNTYRGLNSSLNVTSDEMRLSNDDPQDLCATLRVRTGQVKMGGSAQVGYNEDKNPDPWIDSLRGVYTNHGFQGEPKEDVDIFSQNGMDAKYDAGDSFAFPHLDDPIPGGTTWAKQLQENSLVLSLSPDLQDDRQSIPLIGGKTVNGVTYRLSPDCYFLPLFGTNASGQKADVPQPLAPEISASLLQQSAGLASVLFPTVGQTVLPMLSSLATHKDKHGGQDSGSSGSGSSGSGSSGGPAKDFLLEHNSTPDFSCTKFKTENGKTEVLTEVRWFAATNTFYVGGSSGAVTLFGGDLIVTGGGGQREIGYKGNGVLFTEEDSKGNGGDTIVEIDFLPAAGKTPELFTIGPTKGMLKDISPTTGLTNSYPNTSLVGIVARNSFISQGAQNRFTLAIYAENTVKITKQTLVAGALVTQSFDAGSQVPTVLYVPNLSERLSRFMPGSGGNGFAVSNVAWSRSY